MNTYLVTGGAGFIGSALARVLISEGNQVITIDNLSTGFREAIPIGVEFYEGNCQDTQIIEQLEHYSFDAIFHIAGQSSGEENPCLAAIEAAQKGIKVSEDKQAEEKEKPEEKW